MADQQIFDAEIAAATPKRNLSANLQGLDQVVAISEDSINSILQARFNSQLKRKKDRRLREFHHALPKMGTIEATLKAPRIQMVVPASPESVYFFLNFEKGSFQYWSGFGPDADEKTQDISGWSVAFETNFSLSQLAKVPPAIASQITLLKPGSYSASQLILGFSAAAAANLVWSASVCPGLEENQDLKMASQNVFKMYMDMYMQWLSTGAYSVLGYVIKVEDHSANSNPAKPNFPPTAVRCTTQQYEPATSEFQNQYPARAGLDMIIFEEMVDREFPDVPYKPSKAGNWIVGGVDASLAMSRRIFLEGYVLDQFAMLNMHCLAMANDAYYWVRGWKDLKWTGNDWILTDESKSPRPTSAPWTLNATNATYNWFGERKRSENSFCGGQWRDNVTTTIANELKWTPGSDTATINVSIKQNRDQWNGGHGESPDVLSGGDTSISWTVTITLNTIKAGELSVLVTCSKPDLSYKYQSSQLFWDWGGEMKASYENAALAAMTTGVDMPAIQSQLTEALNGQSKFIFPGGGDFFMKDPRFNTTGDLLIQLSYVQKGIDIDEDFHLQVSAPGVDEVNGKWLKVDGGGDNSAVVLVGTQQEATMFQVDNGNLVVDQAGLPTGLRASTRSAAEPAKAQELVFVSEETLKGAEVGNKVECSTTGSKFAYAIGNSFLWKGTFALDVESKTKVVLFTGKEKDAAPFTVFSVNAIY